jgi:tetratricopeptide (TPR) repeat protein
MGLRKELKAVVRLAMISALAMILAVGFVACNDEDEPVVEDPVVGEETTDQEPTPAPDPEPTPAPDPEPTPPPDPAEHADDPVDKGAWEFGAQVMLAQAALQDGDLERSIEILKKAHELAPGHHQQDHVDEVIAYLEYRETHDAEHTMEHLLEEVGKYHAHVGAALFALHDGDVAMAEHCIEEAHPLAPDDHAREHLGEALAFIQYDEMHDAEHALEHILEDSDGH